MGLNKKTKKKVFKNLKKACKTRWLSFNNSVASLYEHLPAPLVTRSSLPESDAMAYGLLKKIHAVYPAVFSLTWLKFLMVFQRGKVNQSRANMKFFLPGNIYSICDRHFGKIQRFFVSIEVIQVLQQWVTVCKRATS